MAYLIFNHDICVIALVYHSLFNDYLVDRLSTLFIVLLVLKTIFFFFFFNMAFWKFILGSQSEEELKISTFQNSPPLKIILTLTCQYQYWVRGVTDLHSIQVKYKLI